MGCAPFGASHQAQTKGAVKGGGPGSAVGAAAGDAAHLFLHVLDGLHLGGAGELVLVPDLSKESHVHLLLVLEGQEVALDALGVGEVH